MKHQSTLNVASLIKAETISIKYVTIYFPNQSLHLLIKEIYVKHDFIAS